MENLTNASNRAMSSSQKQLYMLTHNRVQYDHSSKHYVVQQWQPIIPSAPFLAFKMGPWLC